MHDADPLFPPRLSARAVKAPETPMAVAVMEAARGGLGAGDLVWARDTSAARIALVLEPEVLLLDEPTAHVDADNATRILELLAEEKSRGRAVLAIVVERQVQIAHHGAGALHAQPVVVVVDEVEPGAEAAEYWLPVFW